MAQVDAQNVIFGHIETITAARTTSLVWDELCRALQAYGFDRLIYGHTRYRDGNWLGNPEDWLFLARHDAAYVRDFIDSGLFRSSPMLLWALDNEGACSWRTTQERLSTATISEDEKKVIDFNNSMGVLAGYTISFRGLSPRFCGILALTASADHTQARIDATWMAYGREIMMLANIAHLRLIGLPHDGGRRLTARQAEVLGWVAEGKATQDIAAIVGISAATVEKHLRLARQALDVETTAQALVKLAYRNQIHLG